jgi:hypothetical protein
MTAATEYPVFRHPVLLLERAHAACGVGTEDAVAAACIEAERVQLRLKRHHVVAAHGRVLQIEDAIAQAP